MATVAVANNAAEALGKLIMFADGGTARTVTNLFTFDRGANPPFAVGASSTKVVGLDADKIDGYEAAAFLQLAGGTMTGVLRTIAGAVGAVALGVGDTDVGLYSSGTDKLDFATAGAKAMGINAQGQIDSPTQFRTSAYRNTTQSIGTGSFTSVQLNAEDYDVGTMHDPVTNNTRITIPTGGGGLYLIVGRFAFAANSTGVRAGKLLKNGATALAQSNINNAGAADAVALSVVSTAVLAAADYIELQVYQNSAGNLDAGHATNRELQCDLQVIRLW
jgi:hypothetical protein